MYNFIKRINSDYHKLNENLYRFHSCYIPDFIDKFKDVHDFIKQKMKLSLYEVEESQYGFYHSKNYLLYILLVHLCKDSSGLKMNGVSQIITPVLSKKVLIIMHFY